MNEWATSDEDQLHPETILRRRGEVLSEVFCRTVTVVAREGEDLLGGCYRDHLPVRMHSKMYLMAANSRILVEPGAALRTECLNNLSPIFKTEDGHFITADPEVREIEINIHHRKSALIEKLIGEQHLHLEREDILSDSLLYTKEEARRWENFMSYHSIKNEVNEAFTNHLCTAGGCGSYEPTGSTFDVSALDPEHAVSYVADYFWSIVDILTKVGAGCSLLVVANVIWGAVSSCFQCCKLTRRGYSARAARTYVQEPWLLPRFLGDGRANPRHPANGQTSRSDMEAERTLVDRVIRTRASYNVPEVELKERRTKVLLLKSGLRIPVTATEYDTLLADAKEEETTTGGAPQDDGNSAADTQA